MLLHEGRRARPENRSRFPAAGIVFGAHVIEAFLERLEIGISVAVEVEADLVEIPEAAVDRQVAAPIVRIALQVTLLPGLTSATT